MKNIASFLVTITFLAVFLVGCSTRDTTEKGLCPCAHCCRADR